MSDPRVDRLTVCGRVCVWEYDPPARDFPGFHLTADARGCKSLQELLLAMKNAARPSKKAIELSAPTAMQLRVPGCANKAKHYSTLILRHTREGEATLWTVDTEDRAVTFRFGTAFLVRLSQGLQDIQAGAGDYCIGADDQPLWFWWNPDRPVDRTITATT